MESLSSMTTEAQRRRLLNEQAAGWLLRLEFEPSESTERELRTWLESSADHMQALLEMTAVDRDLIGLDAHRIIDLEQLIAEVRAEGAATVVPLQEPLLPRAGAFSSQPVVTSAARWRVPAVAAMVAGVCIVIALLVGPGWGSTSYATTTGEQRSMKLADGSIVQLNTRSRVEVSYSEHWRDVRLIDGEALFTVEHDADRPFRVITGATVVRAVGTQFNVYRRSDSTTVAVVEGRVSISGEEPEAAVSHSVGDGLLLDAGEMAAVSNSGAITRQAEPSVARAIAWRQRQLSFDHDSLGYVAEQFNRYNKLQIHIADSEVRNRALEGVFDADQPEALLDFLALDRSLQFERSRNAIVIHKRTAEQAAPERQ